MLFRAETKKLSFSDITDGMSGRYAFVREADGRITDVSGIVRFYGEKNYSPYRGRPGNTARRSWTFCDGDGNELFILTDLGNRSLIQISISGNTKTYRYK